MCERHISSWNLIIGCWNQSLKYADMWGMFCKLRLLGFYPNEFTYGSVLSACVGLSFVNCKNVACWNAITSGSVKHNEDDVGLNLFRQMCSGNPLPNRFTFLSVFGACAQREKLELRKGVHGLVVEYGEQEDLVVGTAIIAFYAKCDEVDKALKKFSRITVRNVVS
ncbi:pentatricopeptide repeat-containing protein [Tanacetum coccineum]